MTLPDRRLNAYRPDLADVALRGRVEAARYVEPEPAQVAVPVADLLSEPRDGAPLASQLLLGDAVGVLDERDGFAWVQSRRDSYVGYVASAAIARGRPAPTHRVVVPRTFVYPGPDMKHPRRAALSLGAAVAVVGEAETRGTRYVLLDDGAAIVAAHVAPAGEHMNDYVATAELLLGTPYLWGGASAFGIDCSGLVQLSLHMAGRPAPRDSDMQAAGLGTPIDPAETPLRRGDLVFWKGHVGIMADAASLVHANGHTMLVSREALADAIARIGYLYGRPTAWRRP